MRIAALVGAFVVALVPLDSPAQNPPAYFDTPGELRVIGTPAAGESLPLVVVLPPTGTSAADTFEMLHVNTGATPFVVLLPAGAPTRDEYLPRFDRFATSFEARVDADIARARAAYRIDPHRIVLVGFSLGGDLAWSFLAHHPERYAGAFVMGSRCSTSLSSASARVLRSNRAVVHFAIGSADESSRRRGLTAAEHMLRAAGVITHLALFDGVHQLPTESGIVRTAFDALLAPRP